MGCKMSFIPEQPTLRKKRSKLNRKEGKKMKEWKFVSGRFNGKGETQQLGSIKTPDGLWLAAVEGGCTSNVTDLELVGRVIRVLNRELPGGKFRVCAGRGQGMGTKLKRSKPGIIEVSGGGLKETQIPIAPGALIRVKMLGCNKCFHVTSYDGKNIEVFVGGDAKIVDIERPREVRRGKAKSN